MPQYDDNEINDYVIMRLKNYFGEDYEINKDRFIQIYLEAEKKGKGEDFVEELAEAVYHQKNSTRAINDPVGYLISFLQDAGVILRKGEKLIQTGAGESAESENSRDGMIMAEINNMEWSVAVLDKRKAQSEYKREIIRRDKTGKIVLKETIRVYNPVEKKIPNVYHEDIILLLQKWYVERERPDRLKFTNYEVCQALKMAPGGEGYALIDEALRLYKHTNIFLGILWKGTTEGSEDFNIISNLGRKYNKKEDRKKGVINQYNISFSQTIKDQLHEDKKYFLWFKDEYFKLSPVAKGLYKYFLKQRPMYNLFCSLNIGEVPEHIPLTDTREYRIRESIKPALEEIKTKTNLIYDFKFKKKRGTKPAQVWAFYKDPGDFVQTQLPGI
jgi:hypothetical protein